MPPRTGRTRRTASTDEKKPRSSVYSGLADALNKAIGENTVVGMDDDQFVISTVKEYISTGCYALDWAMHLDGVPVGRIITIRGDFMSGKSTLAYHIMKNTQAAGGFVVYIETEAAFDKDRTNVIGVDYDEDKWMLIQVDTVEKAVKALRKVFDMVKDEQENGNDQLVTIVWDSVGGTATEAEMTAEFGESRPGVHARLMSAALRQIGPQVAKYRVNLVLLNQDKARMDFFSLGKPDAVTMTAEKPIMFHSTIVLQPKHIGTIQDSKTKEAIGIRVRCTVKKNKLAAPFGKAEYNIMFKTGIDNDASILNVAVNNGLVKKSGAWYVYGGEKFYERDFRKKVLDKHPELMEELEAIRKERMKKAVRGEHDLPDDDDDDEEAPEPVIDSSEEEDE